MAKPLKPDRMLESLDHAVDAELAKIFDQYCAALSHMDDANAWIHFERGWHNLQTAYSAVYDLITATKEGE